MSDHGGLPTCRATLRSYTGGECLKSELVDARPSGQPRSRRLITEPLRGLNIWRVLRGSTARSERGAALWERAMGTAHIEVCRGLHDDLAKRSSDAFRIIHASPFEGDFDLLLVESEMLPDRYNGQMEIVIEGDSIRFKPFLDT